MKTDVSQTKRILLIGVIMLLIASVVLTACGDDDKDEPKSFTVGIANPSSGLVTVVEGFKAGMVDRGYTEGENITYMDDGALGSDQAAWETALQAMIDAKVDLIVTEGTPMSIKAQSMTDKIPILFMPITDPVGAGLVESISKPGGNLTGISVAGQDLPRLGWITRVVPDVKTVYIAYNPNDPAPTSILPDMRQTAADLGIELIETEAPDADAMEAAARNIPDEAEAIFVMPDSLAIANIPIFRESALEHNIPLASIPLFGADLGVLLTYGFDPFEMGRASARLAGEILGGTKPADLPVETAEFYLTINLATADAIGVAVDDDLLSQAKTIIRE